MDVSLHEVLTWFGLSGKVIEEIFIIPTEHLSCKRIGDQLPKNSKEPKIEKWSKIQDKI